MSEIGFDYQAFIEAIEPIPARWTVVFRAHNIHVRGPGFESLLSYQADFDEAVKTIREAIEKHAEDPEADQP